MKKILSTILIMVMFCLFVGGSLFKDAHAASKIEIYGNKGLIAADVSPYIQNGSVMVPVDVIRKLAISGVTLNWNQKAKQVTVKRAGHSVSITAHSQTAKVDEKDIKISPKAVLKNGRMMVPLRFIGESIGEKVNWDVTNRIVSIGDVSSTIINETLEAAKIQELQKAREKALKLNAVNLETELPTVGIFRSIQYFPVGKSDVFFDSTIDRISYYKVQNNKRYEVWSANYKMNVPAQNKELPFFPYKITKEIGKRPTVTSPVAYYQFTGAISDLRYGLIDIHGNETEVGHTDPAETKEFFPVSKEELALIHN